MTIFLHIGSHKTGTTAIQRYLGRHHAALAQQGIWYPKESELLEGGRDAHTHLNMARSLDCTEKSKFFSETQLQEMATNLVSRSKDFEHTIISAEAFWRIGFGRIETDDDPELKWQRKAENVATIRRLLGDHADVTVVGVLRERVSYLQSSYSEFILATFYHKSIRKFLNYLDFFADYRRQLEAWQGHFNIRAFSYEQLCVHHDLPQRFINALVGPIQHPAEAETSKQRFNVGHPIPCVLFKRYLNGMDGLPREQMIRVYNKARRRFQKTTDNTSLAPLHQINSWLTGQEISKLRGRFQVDDDLIRERFCPDFVTGLIGKQAKRDPTVKPLTKEAQHLALGWMLSQYQPKAIWFTPNRTP